MNISDEVVLRTSDDKTFSTSRVLLSRASVFFHDMFKVPQPAEQPDNEVPVITVNETSSTISCLLSWIDPREPTKFNLSDISSIIEPIDKYIMDGVKGSVVAFLHSCRDNDRSGDPLGIWIAAVRLGSNQLAKGYAKDAARAISGPRCLDSVPRVAASALREYSRSLDDAAYNAFERKDRGGHVYKAAFEVQPDWVKGSYHDKRHPECERERIGGSGSVAYREWFLRYVDQLQVEMRSRQGSDALSGIPKRCERILGPANRCDECANGLVLNIEEFNAKMRERISWDECEIPIPDFV